KRLVATLLIMISFAVVIIFISFLILPLLWRQLASLIETLPGYAAKAEAMISAEIDHLLQQYGGALMEKLGAGTKPGVSLADATSNLISQAAQWAISFLNSILTRGAALLNLLSLLVVTPVVTFYMLLDWDKMVAAIDGLVPLRQRETVRALAREIDSAMAGFLRGQALVCLFLGAWYGIGLTLTGLNFGLLIGITAGVLSFVPYAGSLGALIISSGVALVQDWPQWQLLVSVLSVVLTGQFLEGNILSPKLVGESVGLHPVWLIFALLAFGSEFGFTGLLVAVPFAAAAGVILRFAAGLYRESNLYTGASGPHPALLLKNTSPHADREGH
ncbi:MAG TPA: AI-2E family transporter, partial [Methylocella sp.]|nr:AI-2E family transporter [Methylocella sp.]